MKISDMAGFHRLAQLIDTVREFYSVLFHHIAGTAYGSSPVVTMLYHIITGTGYHEAGSGTDVEGVFTVTACSYNVDRLIIGQVDRYTHFEQGFTETG